MGAQADFAQGNHAFERFPRLAGVVLPLDDLCARAAGSHSFHKSTSIGIRDADQEEASACAREAAAIAKMVEKANKKYR